LNEARVAFTRTDDLNLIRKHNNLPIEESDEEDDENLANQNYSATEPVMSVPIQI